MVVSLSEACQGLLFIGSDKIFSRVHVHSGFSVIEVVNILGLNKCTFFCKFYDTITCSNIKNF